MYKRTRSIALNHSFWGLIFSLIIALIGVLADAPLLESGSLMARSNIEGDWVTLTLPTIEIWWSIAFMPILFFMFSYLVNTIRCNGLRGLEASIFFICILIAIIATIYIENNLFVKGTFGVLDLILHSLFFFIGCMILLLCMVSMLTMIVAIFERLIGILKLVWRSKELRHGV